MKECKQTLKSPVYLIYVVVFVLFVNSQLSNDGWREMQELQEPMPGQSYYGETITHDKALIMEGTLANLMEEVSHNSFATYPLGFYKGVNLTEKEMERAKEILKQCTGKSFETLTYEEFQGAMEEICRLVGKGSSYEKKSYENRIYVPMTYEQAKTEYDQLCISDRLTKAGMRLFCDYAGIVLSILPIFIGVSRGLYDKRAKAQQVIFSKSALGVKVVLSRYLANLTLLCLPVFTMAFYLQMPLYEMAKEVGVRGDFWAFLTVPSVWLLPEIMAVLALAFLITEFTDSILAVFVQTVWGIGGLFGASTLVGDFGLKLVARWNTMGESALFSSMEKELFINRGYYAAFGVLCVLLTVLIYERKRGKGEKLYGKVRETDH